METTAFGTIPLDDGQATLPVGPGLLQPAGLDMLATVKDREAMAAAAAFIDAMPRHLDEVRARVMDGVDADPAGHADLFPGLADTPAPSAESLWSTLVLRSVWTGDDALMRLDFGRDGDGDETVLTALFELDGTLVEVARAA